MSYSPRPWILLLVCLASACAGSASSNATPTPIEVATPSSSPDPLASFLQRLRRAVQEQDRKALRELMAEGFSFSFGHQPDRDAALGYWDEHDLWPELDRIVNGDWVPYIEGCMATPAEFVYSGEYYDYRAGACLNDRRWELIFFVAGD